MALSLPSGLAAQFGMNTEGTYGTGTTVTRFLPLVSESVKNEITRIEGAGLVAGRLTMRSDQWRPGVHKIGGDVNLELTDNSIGMVLKHCFGTVNTSSGTHVFWPVSMVGLGATMQFGRPDITGTVLPFTYAGVKVTSWEIAGDADKIGTMGLSVAAKSETTATALASASYGASDTKMTFIGATFTIAGSQPTRVKSFKVSGDNGLDVDRYTAGGSLMLEPLDAKLREYMGEAMLDLGGTTTYERYSGATEAAIVAQFAAGTNYLKFTMNARFDGDTPNIGGPGVLEQPLKFKCVSSTSDAAAISGTLFNNDTTA